MFNNIGKKIKKLATITTKIGFFIFILCAIILCTEKMVALGILIGLVGCLSSWISSFLLYGFGELIDNTQEIAKNTKRMAQLEGLKGEGESSQNTFVEESEEVKVDDDLDYDPENIAREDECPACFHKISKTDHVCSYCGRKLK